MELFLNGSFKSYKYDNFDKALRIMSPWPSSSQANLFTSETKVTPNFLNSQHLTTKDIKKEDKLYMKSPTSEG